MAKLSELIAPSFYDAHRDIEKEKYTHFWFKGGRGKSQIVRKQFCVEKLKIRATEKGLRSFSSM